MCLGQADTEKLTNCWEKNQLSRNSFQGEKRPWKEVSKVRGGKVSPEKWGQPTLLLVLHTIREPASQPWGPSTAHGPSRVWGWWGSSARSRWVGRRVKVIPAVMAASRLGLVLQAPRYRETGGRAGTCSYPESCASLAQRWRQSPNFLSLHDGEQVASLPSEMGILHWIFMARFW